MDVIQKQDRGTCTDKKIIGKKSKKRDVQSIDGYTKLPFTPNPLTSAAAMMPMPEKKEKKEEKRKLKKKISKISEENENLAKVIMEKNNEIADLKRSVQSLNDVLNSVPIDELRCNSSVASTKILDLSKKNRVLRAELETTKNRCFKKDLQIQRLERDLKAAEEKHIQDSELLRKGNFSPIDELNSKITSLQSKLFDCRNKNYELQNQLKLAQKCIQQEVGENFNLNILASQSTHSNWRGRAQQILHLQQKVHELKERLELYENHTTGRVSSFSCPLDAGVVIADPMACGGVGHGGGHGGAMANGNAVGSAQTLVNVPSTISFDRFSPSVRKTELQHQAKVENFEKEINTLKTQLSEAREKILALKVRNKSLSDEMAKYKDKATCLEEQTDFNGLNITTMNEKMIAQKEQYEDRIAELNQRIAVLEHYREEAVEKEERLRAKLATLNDHVAQKDADIDKLNMVIAKLEADLKAICGGFLFSCRELHKEEFIAILDSLEIEKHGLLEITYDLNLRLEEARDKIQALNEQVAKQKIQISRLEVKNRELEKELDLLTERKKRTQRVNEYAQSVTSLNSAVTSFTFENSSISTIGTASDLRLSPSNEPPINQITELKHQLQFSAEKIKLLEERVSSLCEEKRNDVKLFEEVLYNSKNLMIETLKNKRARDPNDLTRREVKDESIFAA